MRRLALTLLLASLAIAPLGVRAERIERGLLAPSAELPAQVAAGGMLRLRVRVASGLTPPPGVQSERALRGFALRLCEPRSEAADSIAESARTGAEGGLAGDTAASCLPLTVRNVRPVDAHSLVYRVEAPVPARFPTGVYDVELRYPGGSGRAERAAQVLDAAQTDEPSREAADVPSEARGGGCALRPPS